MPAPKIHFVRHAETLFNINGQLQGWCDSPLTERGERQAAALGERFRDVHLAAAFTSDLTRTRTTAAAALTGHPHLSPTEMQELREWHFGGWEGQPNAHLWEPVFRDHGYSYVPASPDWPLITANGFDTVITAIRKHDPTGRAETAADVSIRLTKAIATLTNAAEEAAATDAGDILAVTHGVVLGALLRQIAPHHTVSGGFPNCGIATVTWHAGEGLVEEIDSSCALAPHHAV